MSFHLETFDGQVLPQADIERKEVMAAVDAAFQMPGGGMFDYYQDQQAPLKNQRLTYEGVLIGCSHEDLLAKLYALKARVGKKGVLKRKLNIGISRFSQPYCDARLISLTDGSMTTLMQAHTPVSCVFSIISEWRFHED